MFMAAPQSGNFLFHSPLCFVENSHKKSGERKRKILIFSQALGNF
jgi:hypothetical protein